MQKVHVLLPTRHVAFSTVIIVVNITDNMLIVFIIKFIIFIIVITVIVMISSICAEWDQVLTR